MTIKQLHDLIKLLKSESQSNFFTPEDIDSALNAASDDKFAEEKKLLEQTSIISDNLRNFKTSASVTISAGVGSLPADYSYRLAASASNDSIEIDIVPEHEWIQRRNDPIDVPSTTNPIMTIRSNIEVYPDMTPIKLYYIKRPATMVFGYTLSSEDFVYSSGTSTQCDWPAETHIDILRRAAVYLGIPLNDQALMTIENFKKRTENV